jgi:hypothetical protein
MATIQRMPENVGLRYGNASVFEQADTHTREVAQLGAGVAFTVVGAEGEYYRVRLDAETTGFVYAHNLVGSNMPLTASEQRTADERAAAAARPPGGWRGLLYRLDPRPRSRAHAST